MTVAVAHQISKTGHLALRHAAQEAKLRQTDLAVIHVTDSALDLDATEANKAGISDEIAQVMEEAGLADIDWNLHLSTEDHIADAVTDLAESVGAELLVIGARRRSPVGKFLLGSSAQSIILDATMPVLVVKL